MSVPSATRAAIVMGAACGVWLGAPNAPARGGPYLEIQPPEKVDVPAVEIPAAPGPSIARAEVFAVTSSSSTWSAMM